MREFHFFLIPAADFFKIPSNTDASVDLKQANLPERTAPAGTSVWTRESRFLRSDRLLQGQAASQQDCRRTSSAGATVNEPLSHARAVHLAGRGGRCGTGVRALPLPGSANLICDGTESPGFASSVNDEGIFLVP